MVGVELGALGLAAAVCLLAPVAMAKAAPRATESFREEHAQIRKELAHLAQQVGALAGEPPAAQAVTARSVLAYFREHIAPHAAWEERELYPLVDRLAGGGAHRFTSTMRYEHRVVERWIGELGAEASKSAPDHRAFSRRADGLLGLLEAHFEEEEQVLLPIVDRAMTRAQFEAEVHEPAGH